MQRDTDSLEQAYRVGLLLWAVIGGALGAVLGMFLAASRGWPTLPVVLGGVLVGAGMVYVGAERVAQRAGDAAASILVPSGQSTPARTEYSRAQSLAARGLYAEAIESYRESTLATPTAPEPYVAMARLHRDHMSDPERAVALFRQARDRARDPAFAHLVTRELVEVLVHGLGDPHRALPELARLAEQHAETPGGRWAKAEILRLKPQLPPRDAAAEIRNVE